MFEWYKDLSKDVSLYAAYIDRKTSDIFFMLTSAHYGTLISRQTGFNSFTPVIRVFSCPSMTSLHTDMSANQYTSGSKKLVPLVIAICQRQISQSICGFRRGLVTCGFELQLPPLSPLENDTFTTKKVISGCTPPSTTNDEKPSHERLQHPHQTFLVVSRSAYSMKRKLSYSLWLKALLSF